MASSDAKCEAISQPYRFELELVSERPDLDLHSLMHLPAFLAFSSAGPGVHGLIFQVAQGESGPLHPEHGAAVELPGPAQQSAVFSST